MKLFVAALFSTLSIAVLASPFRKHRPQGPVAEVKGNPQVDEVADAGTFKGTGTDIPHLPQAPKPNAEAAPSLRNGGGEKPQLTASGLLPEIKVEPVPELPQLPANAGASKPDVNDKRN
ncbi:hypothetical protein AAVH_28840 [Aphelenchoides avenae]|nr:hypothetical protein AAVH_28840 [Aphelenchus avenae]